MLAAEFQNKHPIKRASMPPNSTPARSKSTTTSTVIQIQLDEESS